MNSHPRSHPRDIDRRRFLKNVSVLGGGLAVGPGLVLAGNSDHYPAKHANRFQLQAEGTGDFRHVIGYEWPAALAALPPDLKFRVRYQFPTEKRDVLSFLIFAFPGAEDEFVGKPVPPALVISGGTIYVDEISINGPVVHPVYGAKPTFGMLGRMITNPQPSPFGPIVGRTSCVTAAFSGHGDDVTFYLFGVSVAGSHATYMHEAKGSLHYHAY